MTAGVFMTLKKPNSSSSSQVRRRSRAVSVTTLAIDQACSIEGVVGENSGCSRTLECEQGLEDQRSAIASTCGGRMLDHGIFAADLIREGRDRKGVLHPRDDVEIRKSGLHHHEVGALGKVELNLPQRLLNIGRIHLIAALVALETALRAYRVAEWPIEGRGIFCSIGHDCNILVPFTFERLADRSDAAVHHV